MSVIIILIVISVTIAVFFLGIFIWAVKSGQYDDTYSPSVRMLFDDKKPSSSQAGLQNEKPSIPQEDVEKSKDDKDEMQS